MGEDQLEDLELDGPITLRIVDGIARDFTQAKWWMWWKTVKWYGLISSCNAVLFFLFIYLFTLCEFQTRFHYFFKFAFESHDSFLKASI